MAAGWPEHGDHKMIMRCQGERDKVSKEEKESKGVREKARGSGG